MNYIKRLIVIEDYPGAGHNSRICLPCNRRYQVSIHDLALSKLEKISAFCYINRLRFFLALRIVWCIIFAGIIPDITFCT